MTVEFVMPEIPTFRLDIGADPDFCAKGHGKRLKALGGTYTE